MISARGKGLAFCREVRKILEAMGHQVEGPGYATAYFQGAIHAIHRDYFGIWDLISFYENVYYFHQVSTIENKTTKIKAIQQTKLPGWVWCRVTEDNQTGFDVFVIDGPIIEEKEMRYFLDWKRRIRKGK